MPQSEYHWQKVPLVLRKELMLLEENENKDGHPGLTSTITVTLTELNKGSFADRLLKKVKESTLRYSFADMYYALVVMPEISNRCH